MIIRHRLRKAPRSRSAGAWSPADAAASDIILVMMAGLLVVVCALGILQG